jgi:hypothetical protein
MKNGKQASTNNTIKVAREERNDSSTLQRPHGPQPQKRSRKEKEKVKVTLTMATPDQGSPTIETDVRLVFPLTAGENADLPLYHVHRTPARPSAFNSRRI